jgi:hypothetical protein
MRPALRSRPDWSAQPASRGDTTGKAGHDRVMIKMKQADRPDFVTARILANLRYDSHSSRRRITPALKLPTRTLREQHHRVPIWNCTGWRLPRFTVTKYARLCGPIPRLIPCGFQRTAVNRHPAPWCPDLPPVAALLRQPATVWLASPALYRAAASRGKSGKSDAAANDIGIIFFIRWRQYHGWDAAARLQ